MLGAYFGSTRIVQGAAGLGDGPLQAYADGVVGGAAPESSPGTLMAYHDGSLGEAPPAAYADGSVGGKVQDPDMPGGLVAYEDGVLGPYPHGQQYASPYSDTGTGPADPTGGGVDTMADMPAPVFSYQDGVLGGRGGTCGLGDDNTYAGDTPISVYRDGILGSHYETMNAFGPLTAYHDGSLGADAGPVLDLGDATTLGEVKSLIAYSSGGYALSAEAQKTYTPDWYTSGIWEPSASSLWQFVVSAIPAFSGKEVSATAGAQTFPNGAGIAYLYGALAAPTSGGMGPDAAAKMFPTIAAWYANKGTAVLPPYLSISDKAKGQRGTEAAMSASRMALWGLGAAALLGVALVFTKKKR